MQKCVLCNGGVAVGFHCDVNRLATAGWARPRPAAAAESSACERGKAPPSATNGQDNSKILRATVQFNIRCHFRDYIYEGWVEFP